MRAFLHIGTEKTGTTSIQKMLDCNRRELLRQGHYVARFYNGFQNREWASYCTRDDRDDDYFDVRGVHTSAGRREFKQWIGEQLTDELQGIPAHCQSLVVTSEHFQSRLLHQDELERLRDLLALRCDEFRICVYLRPQVDMASSYYSITLLNGQVTFPDQIVGEQCRPENPYYDFHALLQRWASVFGRENMLVRLFDPAELLGGELLHDFAAQIGPELPPLLDLKLPRLNESFDPFGQSLLRAINRHVPFLLRGVGKNPLHMELKTLIQAKASGATTVLDPAAAAEVQARFDEMNELVRREYFPERPWLFAPAKPKTPELPLSPEQEELLAEIIGMLARARGETAPRAGG